MNTRALKVLEYNKILNIIGDMASCEDAKRKIEAMLPSPNFDEVESMQIGCAQASSMLIMHGDAPISPLKNVTAALKRTQRGGTMSLGELLAVASVLRVSRRLAGYISNTDKFDTLSSMAKSLYLNKSLEQRLTDAIISDEEVADCASAQLAALRRKQAQLGDKVRQILNSMLKSYSKYLQEPIITMRSDRYVLPVKAEHKASVPGILHDSSSTGATVFIEPAAVVQANNQLRDVLLAQEREIEKIIADFSAEIAEVADEIETGYKIIIEFDVLFAKARFSNAYDCVQPHLNKDGVLNIQKARHPLIDKKTVVPTDIYLGKDFDTLVVTGPNTGGKTVTLKTLGLFALLCQSGVHVPAQKATMPVYEDVFADIGDEQSIEQSLSTFSSHMTNIVDILNSPKNNTLALFDELGAGTDPEEGAALAIEILEYMRAAGAKTAATTHYSELKLYALSTDRVENASCEFDVATLRPTYRLLIGVPGKSNAFAISKRLGLYDSILEKASMRMSAESVRFEDIIRELSQKREIAAEAERQAQKMLAQANELLIENKKREKDLAARKTKLLDEARRQAREIVDSANDEANAIIKDLRKLSMEASAQSVKEAEKLKEKLKNSDNKLAEAQNKNVPKADTKSDDIKIGMSVEILSMNERGTVVSLPNKNGDFFVQIGIMKMTANLRDAIPVKDNTHKKSGERIMSSRRNVKSKSLTIKTELDLRGMTVFEATSELDKFIDDAILASLPRASVIHGKGTGALRSAVHEYLRANRFIKTFRLGTLGEGDTGVTIIEFK